MSVHARRGLRVLVANEDKRALEKLSRLLGDLGHEVIGRAVSAAEVEQMIADERPDLAMVKVHEDEEHALDLIEEAIEESDCPIIALSGGEGDFGARAADRGISGYIGEVREDTVQVAIEVAIRRHGELERLSNTVGELEGALARRAVIERARGILMERHSLDDRAAFELLREQARSSNRRVLEVAGAVLEGHPLLPGEQSGGAEP